MADDLSDVYAQLRELKREVERLKAANPLESASITQGRVRFIGGTLRVDSGGRVEIEGTLVGAGGFTWTGSFRLEGPWTFTGNGTITGNVNSTGQWTQNGKWIFNGDGDIAGDVTATGEWTQNGPWEFNGDGEITGDVVVNGDFHIIAPGKLRVGQFLTVDPTAWTDQARIGFGTSSGTTVEGNNDRVSIGKSGVGRITIGTGITGGDGVHIGGEVHLTRPPVGLPAGVTGKYLIYGSDGIIYTGSAGGGGDPGPGNPPAGNPNGYVWPADPQVYGISDNFAAHVARGSAEPGVDVMTPVGAPLWAPGDGTIVAVQTSPAGATGRYVTLVTDAGDWFRFLHNSQVLVSAGQKVTQGTMLARTGGSGFGSEAYYGPHSHISFKVGFTGTWPGGGSLNDFQAYMASQG